MRYDVIIYDTVGSPQPEWSGHLGSLQYGIDKLPPDSIQMMIAQAEGLFIRNTYEECFPTTVQIGVHAQCKMDIKCVGHEACGIQEAMIPRDLSEDALLPQWLEELHL